MNEEIPGTIERIDLENFMCHRHLQLDLCSQVNFIVGENGSGKSAILVALAICFGAKATFTNRGKRVSDIVKNGETHCKVSVYLRNRGEGAMDKEKYGDTIIIERKISKDGGSSYKIYSMNSGEKPRVVGHKSSDVNEILDHFNIPIDNPCILLMQDTSKTFLTATRAEDKYKFFLEATQLDMIKESYKQAEHSCSKAKKTKQDKKEQIPQMEREIERLKGIMEDGKGIKQIKKKIEVLKREEIWAKYRDQKKKVEDIQQIIEEKENKLNELKEERIEEKIEELKEELKTANEELMKKEEEITEIEKKKGIENEKMKNINKEKGENKVIIDDYNQRIETIKKRITLLKNSIEESKNHDQKDTERAKQQKEEKIKTINKEIESLKRKEELIKDELNPLEKEFTVKVQSLNGYGDDIKHIQNDIKAFENEKDKLEMQKRDKMTIYHPNMPRMIKTIEQTTFEYQIEGPIGEYIQLKDNKWNHAVENCIKKSTLASFVVRTENDKKKLREIAKKINFDIQIYVYNIKFGNQKYDIKKQNYLTLLNVITISSPVIFNILIDHINIDTIAVANTFNDGKELMKLGAKFIYLSNGSFMQKSGKTEAYFPYRLPSRAIYGGQNIEDSIQLIEQQIKTSKMDLQGKVELKNQAKKEKEALLIQLNELKRNLREAERNTRLVESKKKETENIIIKEPEDIKEMEMNLSISKNKLNELLEEVKNQKTKTNELIKREEFQKIEYQKICSLKTQIENESKKQKVLLVNIRKQIDEINENKIDLIKQRKEFQIEIQHQNELLIEEQQQLQEITILSSEFEKIETSKSVESIVNERIKLEKKQQQINLENVNYDEVENELERKQHQLDGLTDQINSIETLQTKLEIELERRKRKYTELLKVTATKTMLLFNQYLEKKPGCKGKIKLDHSKRILDVEVSIDNDSERSAKTLSGGERSYSTVCLLLALWNVVDCPFRAMDEFDVYMDSMARKVAIQTLMETTKSQNKRQYIFITPHNLDGVVSNDNVKVFKIKRPDRDQK
ncbi:structural maintenance of chromosomes, putative [Entamoeba histolytica HM-1:IMSS-B]|uniref:Structural maintenance of chromosomes protein n=4 Tax=Entamoeba histolytica TaxID=5759 RepID=C4M294_ENTH1|nr:structural maintenance of chromosomes protein [Entamoeba histolytica HM-1:IMSS]EAL48428.1 structural maintenance of chromosomes protein [Entamoeba histolytica HM-1:IMSS]EMH72127.1 structural maintenance of chromosomes, putative [Entamoeba histolytica HM-1:IMSS-B]ENY61573.1 structural maintenance of chromosomes protein, putative [Entamoeba histolytica HM-1:IMSS-A]GAT95390.1 structural maintenance of chromosomes protein [Entamoeba histolytica]|eukprot:XP_653814.1 structural maintenance of chromosomes protein [Entamoeba histolytica HM-1:IMSS]